MNYIGEPLSADEKEVSSNANKINKLMQKVNTLSMHASSKNPFQDDLTNNHSSLPVESNIDYKKFSGKNNPFLLSPQFSSETSPKEKISNNNVPTLNNDITIDLKTSSNAENNYSENLRTSETRASAQSVTSSHFIENNFPVFPNLNKPEFKLPSQTLVYNNVNEPQSKPLSTGKRLFSNLNKKLKPSAFNGTLSSTSKKNDENKVTNIKTFEGLLPWEKHLELMQWIDPTPSFAPSYNKCNPIATSYNLQYPIYEETHNPNVVLPPDYKPGIEAVTIVAMKVEFLSPFDRTMFRHWKYYIFELNSTQINFYHLDDELTKDIPNYYDSKDDSCQIREKEERNDFSSYSGQFGVNSAATSANNFNLSKNNNFSSQGSRNLHDEYIMTKLESRQILQKVMEKPAKFLTNKKLCKSFSLQNNDFGIATDCNERPYILRMRSEMEQFLLSFSNVMDMINWSVYLSVGIGISLDLDERSYPNYRTVPIGSSRSRRRRRRLLREERRQRLLVEQQGQTNNTSNQNLKRHQQNGITHKNSILNFSRLRSSSGSSITHNATTGANLEAVERRRSSLAALNDSLLQDESSSLVELSSTIEAERRRRMSNNQSLNSLDSSVHIVGREVRDVAVEDIESAVAEDYYDDDFLSLRVGNSYANGEGVLPMIDDDDRLIERENRRLMEEYTSLTIKRVLREDEHEASTRQSSQPLQDMPLSKTSSLEDFDRNNPALVLTHALTNIQFAPAKKKNTAVPQTKVSAAKEDVKNKENIAPLGKKSSHNSVLNLVGTNQSSDNSSSKKKIIMKLFGKKSSSNTNKLDNKKKHLPKNSNSTITVDSLITAAPTERRQSLVSSKRETASSLSPPISGTDNGKVTQNAISDVLPKKPINDVLDSIENNILAEERAIMEEEMQLENLIEQEEVEEVAATSEELENDESRMNTYEREGLQFEEVGDYVYYQQRAPENNEDFSNTGVMTQQKVPMNNNQSFTNDSLRKRSASIHSQISHLALQSTYSLPNNDSTKYTWAPPRKIMTKKKYIREAIGCIKPLLENETWHGKVISTPCLAPSYETNNPPISGILEELEKVDALASKNGHLFKYGFSQHEVKKMPKFKLILRRCKNHYLKQSVVGPGGYVRF